MSHFATRALLLSGALVLWLVLGFDGRLHWDEPQYIYTGAFFSTAEIVAGDFQPSNIDGFSTSRFAHILLVRFITELLDSTHYIYPFLSISYLLMLLASFWCAYLIVCTLHDSRFLPALGVLLAMFSPIGLYLSFKTLPDIPAFMWSSLALLAFIRLLQSPRHRLLWFVLAAFSLALAALTKHVLIWTFVSFTIATFLLKPPGMPRGSIVKVFFSLSVASLLLFYGILTLTGLHFMDFLRFLTVASAQQSGEPLAAKALHTAMTFGVLWVLLPVAVFHQNRGLTRFVWLWFAIATLPFLIIAPRVEIRYLTPALVPLAGLAALSLDVLRARLLPLQARPVLTVLTVTMILSVVGVSSRLGQTLTAHEVETDSMRTVLARLDARFGRNGYVIVTPWEYSTFLYLRTAYPDRAVYNVFDPRTIGRPDRTSFQDWYFSGRVLRHVNELRAMDRPIFYVGFAEAMPISNLRRLAGWLPETIGEPLIGKLDSLPSLKHISLSWMWRNPALSLELTDEVGNYLVYRVSLVAAHARPVARDVAGQRRLDREGRGAVAHRSRA